MIVVPSEVGGLRHETFKVTQRDPSVRAGLAFSLGMTAFSVSLAQLTTPGKELL